MQEIEYMPLTKQLLSYYQDKTYNKLSRPELALIKLHSIYFKAQKGDPHALVTLYDWEQDISNIIEGLSKQSESFAKALQQFGDIKVEPLGDVIRLSGNCRTAGDYIRLLILYDKIINQLKTLYIFAILDRASYYQQMNNCTKLLHRITGTICHYKPDNEELNHEKIKSALSAEWFPSLGQSAKQSLEIKLSKLE